MPMSRWASCVLPPTCGVRITLSMPRSGETNSSVLPLGSLGNTSMAAPPRCLESSALDQRVDIHHRAARRVDQARALLHAGERRRVDHVVRLRRLRHVQVTTSDDFEQLLERRHLPRVAQRELHFDVVEHHLHAERLRQHADLRADVPVADDARASCRGPRASPSPS